jgi:hypothetical protein
MLKAKKILRDLKHQLKGTKTIFGYYDSENRKESKNLEMSELDLVRALAQYEIDFRKLYGVDYDDALWEDKEGNYELLDLDYGKADNSYNWSSQLVFNFNQIKVVDKYGEDHIYIAFRVHRYGDVRGNYTDTMILDMDMTSFLEECMDASRVYTTVTIKGRDYHISSDCLKEGCLFDIYSNDADIDDYDVVLDIGNLRNKKDIKKAVKEYLVKR